MKTKEILQSTFEIFAKVKRLKIGQKPLTVRLQQADARCGNRWAIVINLPNGCISDMTGYYPPKELITLMDGAVTDFAYKIRQYRDRYR